MRVSWYSPEWRHRYPIRNDVRYKISRNDSTNCADSLGKVSMIGVIGCAAGADKAGGGRVVGVEGFFL
jgi:hypothetical protein